MSGFSFHFLRLNLSMSSAEAIRFGRAVVELSADKTPLLRTLQEAEDRLIKTVRNYGAIMAASGAVRLFGLIPAIQEASKQAETLNAFTQTFSGANAEAKKLVETLANDVGRSVASIQNIATPIGAMAKGLGLSSQEAAEFATSASAAAIDISSFYNQGVEETSQRVRAALSGSSEAVDQFGINLRDSALKAKLAELGYESNLQSASELEKMLARLALIQEALTRQNALGDAARTADQFANSSRSLGDAVRTLSANIGAALMPWVERITTSLVKATRALAEFVKAHPGLVRAFAIQAAAATALGSALITLSVAFSGLLIIGKIIFFVNLARLAFSALTPILATVATMMGTTSAQGGLLTTVLTGLSLAAKRLGVVLGGTLVPLLAKLPLFRVLIPLVTGLGAAFTTLLSPVGLVVAGIAAIGAAILGVYKLSQRSAEQHGKELDRRLQELNEKRQELEAGREVAAPAAEIGEDLENFAEQVNNSTQTPLEKYQHFMRKLDQAFAAGLITAEKRQRAARQAQQELAQSDPARQALKAFGEALRESTRTPQEEFMKQMDLLAQAARAGVITAQELARGQTEAQEKLREANQRLQEDLARQAEEQRQGLLDRLTKRADRRKEIAEALGGEQGADRAARREVEELARNGFVDEAVDAQIAILGDIASRSRDLDQRARENSADSGFGTFSRLEAVSGLGTKSVDEQLLQEAKQAKLDRQAAIDRLNHLLSVLKGEE